MVHPDDRSNVIQGVEYLKECEEVHDLEYRMLGKNGYIWVIDQSRYMEYGGKTFLQEWYSTSRRRWNCAIR